MSSIVETVLVLAASSSRAPTKVASEVGLSLRNGAGMFARVGGGRDDGTV
jgi:hypothetical protein